MYWLYDLEDDTLQAIIHSNDRKETKCHVIIFINNNLLIIHYVIKSHIIMLVLLR